MLDTNFLTILSLGFVLGLRHALDADHVAAVSTVLAERPSWRASTVIGFSWGVGHTIVLFCVGLVVLWLRLRIADAVATAAEFAVGAMLVFLGGSLGFRLVRERWHLHRHDHDGDSHVHLHSHAVAPHHLHAHWWQDSIRPLCIGMAHGLAGSAALLLLVVSSSPTVMDGLLYILVFGAGSILGMVLIGAVLTVPVLWSISIGRHAFLAVQGMASLGSIALGCSMMLRIWSGEPPL